MARGAVGLILALLLSPGLAGCLGEDTASQAGPVSAVAVASLPEGIELTGAQAGVYNETYVELVWEDVTPYESHRREDDSVGGASPLAPATAELTLPPGAHYEILFRLTWPSSDDLDFYVKEDGDWICQGRSLNKPETCPVHWVPASNQTRVWTIEVVAFASGLASSEGGPPSSAELPFSLTVVLRPTGPYGLQGAPRAPGGPG